MLWGALDIWHSTSSLRATQTGGAGGGTGRNLQVTGHQDQPPPVLHTACRRGLQEGPTAHATPDETERF